jgi:hypothetical protein
MDLRSDYYKDYQRVESMVAGLAESMDESWDFLMVVALADSMVDWLVVGLVERMEQFWAVLRDDELAEKLGGYREGVKEAVMADL